MTKEEAISVLNDYDINFERNTPEEVAEAHEIAIKAIFRTIPNENEKVIRISKGTLKARTGKYVIYDVEWLKTHFNTTEAKIYGQPSEDWNAVLDELNRIGRNAFKDDTDYDNLFDFISNLPSVTPQQKTGHWIGHREHCEKLGVIPSGLGVYEWCSNCGHGIDIRDWSRISHNYCPKCGAKMQEVQK